MQRLRQTAGPSLMQIVSCFDDFVVRLERTRRRATKVLISLSTPRRAQGRPWCPLLKTKRHFRNRQIHGTIFKSVALVQASPLGSPKSDLPGPFLQPPISFALPAGPPKRPEGPNMYRQNLQGSQGCSPGLTGISGNLHNLKARPSTKR